MLNSLYYLPISVRQSSLQSVSYSRIVPQAENVFKTESTRQLLAAFSTSRHEIVINAENVDI